VITLDINDVRTVGDMIARIIAAIDGVVGVTSDGVAFLPDRTRFDYVVVAENGSRDAVRARIAEYGRDGFPLICPREAIPPDMCIDTIVKEQDGPAHLEPFWRLGGPRGVC